MFRKYPVTVSMEPASKCQIVKKLLAKVINSKKPNLHAKKICCTHQENLLLIPSNFTRSEDTCWLSGSKLLISSKIIFQQKKITYYQEKNYCSEEILLLINKIHFLLFLVQKGHFQRVEKLKLPKVHSKALLKKLQSHTFNPQ